jgi:phospholipase A1
MAQPPTPQEIAACAAIGSAADRLACYDKLAGRAPAQPATAVTQQPLVADTGSPSLLAPPTAPVPPAAEPRADASLLSKLWELDPQDKRGTFLLTGYRTNYLLPAHVTSRINRAPQSPTQATVPRPAYRKLEAKFQVSLRTKVVQGLGWDDADLWMGYTQQALWQIYNGTDSKPFRNTDYEPELMYVVPTDRRLRQLPFEWQWRYWQLGLAHQSNGQSDPLSRSWNRVYLAGGFERGPWSLIGRVNKRIREEGPSDNNPDLVSYRGRGEFLLTWASGAHLASLQYRSTLQTANYGSLTFEYSYPVFSDQPNGMRWFVQAFQGYGETLTDYNFRQTSLGAGVSFVQF